MDIIEITVCSISIIIYLCTSYIKNIMQSFTEIYYTVKLNEEIVSLKHKKWDFEQKVGKNHWE